MSASGREFLKVAGAGAASTAVVVGCGDARMTHEQAKR
jgi:hypothetical protein